MKKFFITAILSISVAVSISGCSSSSDVDTNQQISEDNQSIEDSENSSSEIGEDIENTKENETNEDATVSDSIGYNITPIESEYTEDSGDTVIYSYSYDSIELTDADKYPELKASLDKLEEISSPSDGLIELSRENFEMNNNTNDYKPFFENYHNSVARADSKVFSILQDYTMYMGGTFDGNWSKGFNYDTQTREKIEIEDVVTDINSLHDIIFKKLTSDYPDAQFYFDSPSYFEATMIDHDVKVPQYYTFTMDNDGIKLYFDCVSLDITKNYEISLKYDDYPELLVSKYFTDEQ